jgi:hypothetical protein
VIYALLCPAPFDASVTHWEVMITSKLSLPARFACLQFAVSSIIHVLMLLNVRLPQPTGKQVTRLSGVSAAHVMG